LQLLNSINRCAKIPVHPDVVDSHAAASKYAQQHLLTAI
jgi:hypothetical protein